MPANSTGNCYLCGANLSKTAIKNHLIKVHGVDTGGQECYLLKIEGEFDKGYWLYIDVPVKETLKKIDIFLRAIWLECCGHMSAFFLPRYSELSMNHKLETFEVGAKFSHHYDFGSTTETVISILGTIRRKPQKKAVRLLARNVPPVFTCMECGKTAEYIDTELRYQSDNPFYCEKCSEKYEGTMILPIVNSPRMGECGYTGEENDTFTFNPASFAAVPK